MRTVSYWGSGGLRGVCAVTVLVRTGEVGLGRSGRGGSGGGEAVGDLGGGGRTGGGEAHDRNPFACEHSCSTICDWSEAEYNATVEGH